MQSRLMDVLEAPPAESPEARAAVAERAAILRSCLHILNARQRVLIELRYERAYTLRMIAVEFGVGEPAVHAMHERAMRALRQALDERRIQSITDLL
jgi:RNA polymerase sigma factor (sigma-70 family)